MNTRELATKCRTYRRFLPTPIDREALGYALENARRTSTAANQQQLRFYAIHSPENVAAMQPLVRWAAALPPELGVPHDDERPVAFIVIASTAQKSLIDGINIGLAAHAITTSLCEQGIGSCMMAAIDIRSINKLIGIDGEKECTRLTIAIGLSRCTSTIVEPKDNSLKYYVDENRNYYVPKRSFDELVTFL